MPLILANLPDDPDQLASWLDQQIVSDRLPQLAGELAACHSTDPSAVLTDDEVEQAVASGVAGLSPDAVSRLMQDPSGLLELQGQVLASAGESWADVPADADTLNRLEAGRGSLAMWLAEGDPTSSEPSVRLAGKHASASAGWFRTPESRLAGMMGLAASLLLCFFAGRGSVVTPEPKVAWGWNAPGLTVAADDRAAYLNRLADGADAWFNKRPDTPEALAARISEFRRGCTTLLLSEHPPLTEDDKAWLQERCLAWAEKIDSQLLALERGEAIASVQEAMDGLVKKLTGAIRKQAAA